MVTKFIFIYTCVGLFSHNIIWITLKTFSIAWDQTMRQFTWIVSEFISILTNLTTSKEILFASINETKSFISIINKRSFATCAQTINIIAPYWGCLASWIFVNIKTLFAANTFLINIPCNTVWIIRWACSIFIDLIIFDAFITSFLIDFETVLDWTESIWSKFEWKIAFTAFSCLWVFVTTNNETCLLEDIVCIILLAWYTLSFFIVVTTWNSSNTFFWYTIKHIRRIASRTYVLFVLNTAFFLDLALVVSI
mgnify:CR=1 FL=1